MKDPFQQASDHANPKDAIKRERRRRNRKRRKLRKKGLSEVEIMQEVPPPNCAVMSKMEYLIYKKVASQIVDDIDCGNHEFDGPARI